MYRTSSIAQIIEGRIVNGYYQSGQRLPSIPRFATEFKVSSATFRKVIDHLEEEGLISVVPRVGTFVVYNNGYAQPNKTVSILRERINTGAYEYFLPTRGELESEFGVSRTGLKHILDELEDGGLIQRDGSGIIYAGGDGKKRYLLMLFHQEFPNGTTRSQFARQNYTLYRRFSRNGLLGEVIPANPKAVEHGKGQIR